MSNRNELIWNNVQTPGTPNYLAGWNGAGAAAEIAPHFKGSFASLAALNVAFPTAAAGNYALVDVISSNSVLYIWDPTDNAWVIASGGANFYTTDGTLTSPRTVTGSGTENLTFTFPALGGTNIGFLVQSNNTNAIANNQQLAAFNLAGANATASQLTYALVVNNQHTGATSTNIAIHGNAAGATNNWGLSIAGGSASIGTLPASQGASLLYLERANTDGGATLAPIAVFRNLSPTIGSGAVYNLTGINFNAGNTVVQGQTMVNYGNPAGVPFSFGSGLYVGTRTAHPLVLMYNSIVKISVQDVAVSILGDATRAGELRLYENTLDGVNYTALKPGAQSVDITYTLPPAYPAVTGYVLSATTAGVMTWIAMSGGGGVTLGAIGSTPNANAATLTGSVLNLEPASASFGGIVTTAAQTFAGDKTFSGTPTFSTAGQTRVFYGGLGGILETDVNFSYSTLTGLTIKPAVIIQNTAGGGLSITSSSSTAGGSLSLASSGGSTVSIYAGASADASNLGKVAFTATLSEFKFWSAATAGSPGYAGSLRFYYSVGTPALGFSIVQNKVAIGNNTTPTAYLHLPAGTAAVNTGPIKLVTGVPLTTPEDGVIEYHASHLWFTIGSTRFQLDQQAGGGGTPAGATTELQRNNAGAFGGAKIFTGADGNITFGDSGLSGAERKLITVGSASDIVMELHGKGTLGGVKLIPDTAASSTYFSVNKAAAGGVPTGMFYVTTASPAISIVSIFDYRGTAQNDIFSLQVSSTVVNLYGGTTGTSGTSKTFYISGAIGAGTKPPSNLELSGGDSGIASGAGGLTTLRGGDNTGGTSTGGGVTIKTGDGTSIAGNLLIDGKTGTFTLRAKDSLSILQGTGSSNGGPYVTIARRTANPPLTSGTNLVIYGEASVDGTTALSLYPEQVVEAIGTFTPAHKVKIQYRGVWYWMQLQAV